MQNGHPHVNCDGDHLGVILAGILASFAFSFMFLHIAYIFCCVFKTAFRGYFPLFVVGSYPFQLRFWCVMCYGKDEWD